MKFTGVKDEALAATIRKIHEEVLPRIMALGCSWVTEGRATGAMTYGLKVTFSNRMAVGAGSALTDRLRGTGEIRLNYRLLKDKPEELKDVYLHELAHVVATLVHDKCQGHNGNWKDMAVLLGARPETYHSMDVSHLRKAPVRIAYKCGCRNDWKLTPQKHKKRELYFTMYNKNLYSCRTCKMAVVPAA